MNARDRYNAAYRNERMRVKGREIAYTEEQTIWKNATNSLRARMRHEIDLACWTPAQLRYFVWRQRND